MLNFCAVFGCSNRSNREKDKGCYRIPAIVSRSNPKKQALSVERLGSPVLEGKILPAGFFCRSQVAGHRSQVTGHIFTVQISLQNVQNSDVKYYQLSFWRVSALRDSKELIRLAGDAWTETGQYQNAASV